MSRVAIVSYYAPPQPAVASHRVLRVTRVLVGAGHEVHWVTLPSDRLPLVDRSLEKLIPASVRVHGVGTPCAVTRPAQETFWQKVELTLAHAARDWLALPDAYVGWLWALRRRLPRLIAREGIDTIYVCCGPHSPILLIPGLRKRFPRLRILVDYRDLLSGNAWNDAEEDGRRTRILAREQEALAVSDALFLNTDAAYERFRSVVKAPASLPVKVVRNAADYDMAGELEQTGSAPALGPGVHLGYFGNVFTERRLRPVCVAMAALPEALRERVRLHCYSAEASQKIVAEDCEAAGVELGREVLLHDPVDYGDALLAMRAMDALVLVNGPTVSDRIFVPGKLFDYLMARRPVLFVGEPGDASRIVTDCCGEGWCTRHDEVDARCDTLERLCAARPKDIEPNEKYDATRTFRPIVEALVPGRGAAGAVATPVP